MDLSKYYDSICKEPILTAQEELKLILAYRDEGLSEKDRQKAKDKVLRANLRFVFKQAKNYSRNDPSLFEDLISAGNEGLIVGLEKYDPSRKIRFLSYAGWWVIQRILKEMSRMRIVSLPIWKQQLATRIMKAKDSNEKMTLQELIIEFPDVQEKDLRELHETRYLTYYINDLQEDNFEINSFNEDMDREVDNHKIYDAVMMLKSPYREILSMTYGFEDGKEYSLVQIAKRLMLTKDQLREYKKEAHEMVREKLSAK